MIASAKRAAILILIAAILVTAGCNDAKTSPPGKAPVMNVEAGSPATDGAARAEADAFLKLLTSGDFKAAVEKVAPAFRKQVSGTLTFEEEKKLGYSDSDTEKYLKAATAGAARSEIKAQIAAPSGSAAVFRGDLVGTEPRSFSLRMIKDGSSWKVSRFASAKLAAIALPKESGDKELTWARQSALDFLESLVGGGEEQLLTMAAMSEELKASVPSPSIADAGLTYAKKDVRDWLNKARQAATGFAIAREETAAANAIFSVELTGGPKPVAAKLELTRAGDEWKVAKLDVQP